MENNVKFEYKFPMFIKSTLVLMMQSITGKIMKQKLHALTVASSDFFTLVAENLQVSRWKFQTFL